MTVTQVRTDNVEDLAITTAKVANDAITYAKMQNVSATDKVLGRSTAGSGDTEEIAFTAAARSIADDATVDDIITTLGGAAYTGSSGLVRKTGPTISAPTFTGTTTAAGVALSSGTVTNVPTPSASTDAANKDYVDNLILGLKWKQPVRLATTGISGTLASSFENGDTMDGQTLVTGDRILIKDQASATENGIYTVNASGAPTRATDADAGAELVSASVVVMEGTANADKAFVCTNNSTITLGVTNIAFATFNTALASISLTGDVTGTGTTGIATTIANDAVTFAKMQNIATASLIGRGTAGTGDPENLTLGAGLAITAGVLNTTGTSLTTSNFVTEETPSGTVNGVNATFTIANTPTAGTVRLHKNGLRMKSGVGNDYTISGTTITMLTGAIPQTGDILIADYMK